MSSRNDASGPIARARYLRRNMTLPEKQAWAILRLMPQRFRRQVPVGPYVLDFYSPRFGLCVEIDGPLHDAASDRTRDQALEELDIYTLRVSVEELEWEGVLERKVEEVCRWRKKRF